MAIVIDKSKIKDIKNPIRRKEKTNFIGNSEVSSEKKD